VDDCNCEPDVGDDEDFPDEEPIGNTHYTRTCEVCASTWESLHCPHDGIQNPCPSCGWRPVGSRSPMEAIGARRPPGEE
jgi:predicted RNA-binding Zn-ribbon protein involved in translation (DUF1610 family)